MKILITGVNGLLGYDLYKLLTQKHEVFGAGNSSCPVYVEEKNWVKFDISNQKETYDKVSKINPDVVIHSAALSNVDLCEKEPKLAYCVNALGTRNLCLACQRFDTVLCYISTDYVFDGINPPDGGYSEFDKSNPLSVYGKSKHAGEFYVKHLLNRFIIVRPAWIFGSHRNNFIAYVVDSIKQKKKINVVKKHFGCPTYTMDLSNAIFKLIENNCFGLYHLTNTSTSREEVVNFIFDLLKEKIEVNLVERKDVYFAQRPANSSLKNQMWEIEGFKPLRTWKEAITDFIVNELKI